MMYRAFLPASLANVLDDGGVMNQTLTVTLMPFIACGNGRAENGTIVETLATNPAAFYRLLYQMMKALEVEGCVVHEIDDAGITPKGAILREGGIELNNFEEAGTPLQH